MGIANESYMHSSNGPRVFIDAIAPIQMLPIQRIQLKEEEEEKKKRKKSNDKPLI